MTNRLDPAIIERLSDPCIEELKSSAEKGLLNKEDCLKLTKEISKKVHNDVKEAVKNAGYNSSTIICLLSAWYKYKPKEVWMVTLLNILRSHNLNNDALVSLAQRLEEIYTKIRKPHPNETISVNGDGNNNDMEVDGRKGNTSVSPEEHNSSLQRDEFQMSKRLARQALKNNEEAQKTNEKAKRTNEEARKIKEEAQRIKDEAAKEKEEAMKKEEEVLKKMENIRISTKRKVEENIP